MRSKNIVRQGGILADKYIMDGCKLMWHPERVGSWLKGERIVPIHIDVGLTKGCNIRCEYCFGVLQGNFYKRGIDKYFPREPLLDYMRSAGEIGVRSMVFIGEGEPLLNPYVYEAIRTAKMANIDVSLGTNGLLYDMGERGKEALKYLSWLRFNISACNDKSYRKIHGSKDWERFIKVVSWCVEQKAKHNLKVTIGFQSVLTPNNLEYMVQLAKLGRELGIDYHVIKQCSDDITSSLGFYNRLEDYDGFTETLKEAEAQTKCNYNVIVKWGMIGNKGKRDYDRCFGVPFVLYSSGDGNLFPCGAFFDDRTDEFMMGDLTKQSFREIWESDRYWQIVNKVSHLDVHKCYSNCRTHFVNDYLWRLKHPPEHVNFI